MTKPPAFQFYAKDWLTGTMAMSLELRGFYGTLLSYQWDKGGVPGDDLAQLARATSCERSEVDRLWPEIRVNFKREKDGIWRNRRLKQQWRETMAFRKSQSIKGKNGGRPKSRGFPPALTGGKPDESPEKALRTSSSVVRTDPPKSPVARGTRRTRKDRQLAEAIRRSDPWGQREKTAEMQRLIAGGMSPAEAQRQVFE